MKSFSEYVLHFSLVIFILFPCSLLNAEKVGQWVDLFNGKDLSGWIDVNTSPETWWVEDGMLKCSGKPIGVMRSERQYENFLLHVEWRHMEAGGIPEFSPGVMPFRLGTVCPRAWKFKCLNWTG